MLLKKKKINIEGIKKTLEKFTGYIALGIAVLLVFSLLGSISKIRDVNTKIDKEREVLEKLKKDNENLQKDLQKAQSEEFIEKQLRDKLGMAKEGEIVVILPDEETVKKFAPSIDIEKEPIPDPNWKKWLKLFL
jgi:cell division protein FtsB